jgi:4-coumarate--CoA ligase
VKGFQVAPAELEEIIRDHPKIIDAAVIGVPHTCNGESPRAFVVKKPNEEVTEKEIQDYVAAKVAVYKKLEGGVVFLETIPKNASGKILRRKLKEDFC